MFYLNFSWHPSKHPFWEYLDKLHTQFQLIVKMFYWWEAFTHPRQQDDRLLGRTLNYHNLPVRSALANRITPINECHISSYHLTKAPLKNALFSVFLYPAFLTERIWHFPCIGRMRNLLGLSSHHTHCSTYHHCLPPDDTWHKLFIKS